MEQLFCSIQHKGVPALKIVTTTSVFPPCCPTEKAMERLAAIGFDALDLAIDNCVQQADFPYMTPGWRDWAKRLHEKAEKLGVSWTHSHSCGDASATDDASFRVFETCSILHIPYTVIHPVFAGKNGVYESEDEFLSVNIPLIRRLLPYAEQYGVTILSENLLWGASARPEVISRLVKEVNSSLFGWCFDTGHANCFGIPPGILNGLESIPLSLHMQDNHGSLRDEHLIPGDGCINWKELLDTLRAVGYGGDLVLEAHHQSLEAEDDAREDILRELLTRTGKMRDYLNKR